MEAEAQPVLQHCSQETSMQEKEIGPVEKKKKNHKDPAQNLYLTLSGISNSFIYINVQFLWHVHASCAIPKYIHEG